MSLLNFVDSVRDSPVGVVETSPRASATLALALSSIFGSSFRDAQKALWSRAASELKKTDSVSAEPWVQSCLALDFMTAVGHLNEASTTSGTGRLETRPLAKVSELNARDSLLDVWSHLFTAIVQTTCSSPSPPTTPTTSAPPIISHSTFSLTEGGKARLALAISNVLGTAVAGTSTHTLAVLTAGVWSMGMGDGARALEVAKTLALEIKAEGPAARLASAGDYLRLLSASIKRSGEDSKMVWAEKVDDDSVQPAGEVDAIVAIALRWLELSAKSASMGNPGEKTKPDETLYKATIELRRLVGVSDLRVRSPSRSVSSNYSRGLDSTESLSDTSSDSGRGGNEASDNFFGDGGSSSAEFEDAVDSLVGELTKIGRRAAGLPDVTEEDDSGCEIDDM